MTRDLCKIHTAEASRGYRGAVWRTILTGYPILRELSNWTSFTIISISPEASRTYCVNKSNDFVI